MKTPRKILKKIFFFWCRFAQKCSLFGVFGEFSHNKKFDCRDYDAQIAAYVDKKFKNHSFVKKECDNNKIAFLATEFNDTGGHTKLASNLISLLASEYKIATFLVRKKATYKIAPRSMTQIEQNSTVDGMNCIFAFSKNNVEKLFLKIWNFNPKVLFVFTNMNDVVSVAALYMLKKFTDIKVVYFNHASHFPALGFSFADLIIECMPTTHYVTKHYRGFDKCAVLGLVDEKIEDVKYYSHDERAQKRKELGINDGNYFTLSGAAAYKFFDEGSSKYFCLIKEILEAEHRLQHIVITELNEEQKNIVAKIFADSTAKERLIFIPFTTQYPLIFQACDVFIDSFPVSSALAQIELMKWKKPTVVKINRENAMLSFHEYFPEDYAYMFEDVEDMKNGIFKLLCSHEERDKVSVEMFSHFMHNFEGNAVFKKYENVIENIHFIEKIIKPLDKNIFYTLDIKNEKSQ